MLSKCSDSKIVSINNLKDLKDIYKIVLDCNLIV